LGVEGDLITISDGSGGDGTSRDARPTDEEASTSLVAGRTPWPAGLRSIKEQRKKEEEEREQETRRQLQEQERRPELQELQEQQQGGQQLAEPLDPPQPELEAP